MRERGSEEGASVTNKLLVVLRIGPLRTPESNGTGDSTALERPSLPERAYATAASQLMPRMRMTSANMLYQMIHIVAVVVVLGYLGQYAIGPLEDQMRDQHIWIDIGLNVTIRMFWHGDILVERAITPFQVVIPRDQVAPAA
ncbi:hypothetical protein EDB85DRAFT_1900560 [Lactarius pseudohatsudake]|nr:hypothetical protein EDB85DRAFT_1900560 [Lactarius pseudohatsudake]